jgi:hypothetical protein
MTRLVDIEKFNGEKKKGNFIEMAVAGILMK